MKLSVLSLLHASALLWVETLAAPQTAAVSTVPSSYPVSEISASLQIAKWQLEYNVNVLKSLAGKKTGCTIDKLSYRREWSVKPRLSRQVYLDRTI